jgi:SAM-dependent methyltransferase
VEYARYLALRDRIVPGLRFNQAIYEEVVTEHVDEQTVWLDAGCGQHIFSPWRREWEQRLVGRARLVVGCDIDDTIRKHHTLRGLLVADLERLPFKPSSVTLVTCNMVVEHLERPESVFSEFAEVLKPGGRVIVHTPNALSYFTIGARLLPRRFKLSVIRALDGRTDSEVFPARYRANTPWTLRRLMANAGLEEERLCMVASDAVLAMTSPALVVAELLYLKLLLRPRWRAFRPTMLAVFTKRRREGDGLPPAR